MTIQQAIEKAIAGGWQTDRWGSWSIVEGETSQRYIKMRSNRYNVHDADISVAEAVLDPAFWRALGKTEGWLEKEIESNAKLLTVSIFYGHTIEEYFASL